MKSSQSNAAGFGLTNGSAAALPGASLEIKPPAPTGARTPDYTNPPLTVTPPALPDRLKPPDDKKYFPQLKRF